MNKLPVKVLLSLFLFLTWAITILAQSVAQDSAFISAEPSSQSGYSVFGGPSSVGAILKKDQEAEPALKMDLLDSYFGLKQRMAEDQGFSFGFDYFALIQYGTESPGEDTAAGGVFRAYGSWTLVGKESGDTVTLVYNVENRHRLGTDIAPKDLGFDLGYAGLTAVTFRGDWDNWALTNLYWSQHLLNNRLAFVVGDVDVTDYLDVYGLIDTWNEFNNYAFATNLTIPKPE